jgi:hypothetical protein
MNRNDKTKKRRESRNKNIPVGARFSAFFQTGHETHSPSYKIGTGFLSRG